MTEQYDKRHGGAWDRGSADNYYRRPYKPHKYVGGTGTSERVESLSADDLAAYEAGWNYNEQNGDFKDYG
tara:strand:+ start:177 stop:386 length:210 start_codon:yes stop_codon:yes gene_type:complete